MKKFYSIFLGILILSCIPVFGAIDMEESKQIEVLVEDKEIPTLYNGIDREGTGLTSKNSSTLEVTIKETTSGMWDLSEGFKFTLPEGVYVVDAEILGINNIYKDGESLSIPQFEEELKKAYVQGEFKEFDFKANTFDKNTASTTSSKKRINLSLNLVANPTFQEAVSFGIEGSGINSEEVDIGKFQSSFMVEFEANDIKMGYRCIPSATPITIKEYKAGLLEEGSYIELVMNRNPSIDKQGGIEFEHDIICKVDKNSKMEVLGDVNTNKIENDTIRVDIKKESVGDFGVVTIENIEFFMKRNTPDDGYYLDYYSSMENEFLSQVLYGGDTTDTIDIHKISYDEDKKEAFINIIHAESDATIQPFTTKIVIPLGENYFFVDGVEQPLDTPAYISDTGDTMLPIRAVSTAIGVDENNVIWNEDTKSITIMYGTRIIFMGVGADKMTINGAEIPLSIPPEIMEGRGYLSLRELAGVLGISDMEWNEETKTATLN